jgi:hypothetical protein
MAVPEVTVDRDPKPAPRWRVVKETLRSWGSGPAATEQTVEAFSYTTVAGWVTFRDADGGVVLDLAERTVLSVERIQDEHEEAAAA